MKRKEVREKLNRGRKKYVRIFNNIFNDNYWLTVFYEDCDGLRGCCKWCFKSSLPDWRWDFVKEIKADCLETILDVNKQIVSKELLSSYITL